MDQTKQTNPPLMLLRRKQVEEATGLSKATIYRLIVQHQFPKPFKLSERAVAWRLDEINDWISSRLKSSVMKGGLR
jgi:prophage regulatory protein